MSNNSYFYPKTWNIIKYKIIISPINRTITNNKTKNIKNVKSNSAYDRINQGSVNDWSVYSLNTVKSTEEHPEVHKSMKQNKNITKNENKNIQRN